MNPTPDGTYQRDYLHVVDLPAFWADATKAKQLLGWEAIHTVDDMCRSSWLFAKNASI